MNDERDPRSLAALIPVLGRPRNAGPLHESFQASVERERSDGWQIDLIFVCTPGDNEQIAAARATGAEVLVVGWPAGPGDYSRKINRAAALTDHVWLFTGADDLRFHPGWLRAALNVHVSTGALVIGTNDLHNATVMRGQYATHLLVHRSYLDRCVIDAPGQIFHEGYSHNCNTGDAPIWMGDLDFKDLRDVEVGDIVIGWKRRQAAKTNLNRLKRAEVLSKQSRLAHAVELEMASGRKIRCTPDHLWLNPISQTGGQRLPEYLPARIGKPLLHVIDRPEPIPSEYDRLAGWIAGMYDGEGGGVYIATQSTAVHPDIFEAVGHVLDVLEIPYSRIAGYQNEVGVYVMTGGKQAYLNFLLGIRPIKRQRLEEIIFKSNRRDGKGAEPNDEYGAARFGRQDRVVAIRDVGEQEVFSLMTTAGNYIAWGYASKNCVDTELVETAKSQRAWGFARDSHVEHLHHVWRLNPDDVTYQKGRRDHAQDRALLKQRRPLWNRQRVFAGSARQVTPPGRPRVVSRWPKR